jgi:hypothetical protein
MALHFTASCSCGEVRWHRTTIWPFSCFGNHILKKLNTSLTYSNQETVLSKYGNVVVCVTALDTFVPYNNFVYLLAFVTPCNFVCWPAQHFSAACNSVKWYGAIGRIYHMIVHQTPLSSLALEIFSDLSLHCQLCFHSMVKYSKQCITWHNTSGMDLE